MASGAVAPPAAWPLVGRHQELRQLTRSLEAGGAVLVGPPGVGKSRLAAEAAALAARRGWTCRHVLPSPGASTIPLGALASLLDDAGDLGRVGLVARALDAVVGSGAATVLLVVDDAHLLDDTSAAVVHQAVASRRVRLVATVRAGEPVRDSISALWKDDLVERIDVGPLAQAAVEELIGAVLGGNVDGAAVHRLSQATEGNPLFVRELVLGAVDSGVLSADGGLWRLRGSLAASARLHEIVLARVADTTAPEREVLELLAVGEPMGLVALLRLGPADAVERLERRGLLAVSDDGDRRPVRLAHPLHGEILRSRMPAIARMRVSRQLADDVEAAGAHRRDDVVRVAVWRLEGGGDANPDVMLAAARLAYAGRDLATAERLARASVGPGAGLDGGLLHSTLLAELGRLEESDDVLVALAETASTDEEHALVALRHSLHRFWALGDPQAAEIIDRVEARVEDPAWRQELTAQRANLLALGGRPDEALAAGAGLLDSSSARVVVRASSGAAAALALAARFDEAVAVAGRAWRRQNDLIDQRAFGASGFHLVIRTLALAEAGRLDEAAGHGAAGYEVTVETGDAVGQGWFALTLARTSLARGDLDGARRWATECAALFAETDQRAILRGVLGTLALTTAMQGDRPALAGALEQLGALPAGPLAFLEPDVDRARAWGLALGGDLGAARASLRDDASAWRSRGAVAPAVAMAADLIRLGDRVEAMALLADLTWPPVWPVGDAIAAWAEAVDGAALEAAAHTLEGLGFTLLAAEAAAQAATAWQSSGSARKGRQAAVWSAALAATTGAATPALAGAGDAGRLTRREQEVAGLAATGVANRVIAERLALSERTVENHLQRAYVKLGISSRDDLRLVLDNRRD